MYQADSKSQKGLLLFFKDVEHRGSVFKKNNLGVHVDPAAVQQAIVLGASQRCFFLPIVFEMTDVSQLSV